MITQFQDLYFDSRKEGTTKDSGYIIPDFYFLGKSYGLQYFRIADNDYENEERLKNIFNAKEAAIIEFDVGENTVVYPKLEVNMPVEDLNPKLPVEELQQLMLIDKR